MTYNIQHNPLLDVDLIAEFYSEKDGVPVVYVCTSAILRDSASAVDVFFRETPHPDFGNRYFGLYVNFENNLMITNADNIESLDFVMTEIGGALHYSQHRHDFRTIGDVSLDGGRSYSRRVGNISYPTVQLKVKDGRFVPNDSNP